MTTDPITLGERYVLESSIASGGMATVWRARDDILARPVAVKILHPQLAADEAFVERFRREALSAARLSHPHIVSIYDTGSETSEQDGIERHYIVMEFCGGGTLAELVKAEGLLEADDAATVVATICDALAYAHRNGLVHRDIKPQNVLLTDQRTLKVADFGIAKAAFTKSDITATGAILGTVTYLSPEQVLGHDPGPPSDIYSVGVVLHELLAGRPPFEAETPIATAMAHAHRPPPPVRTFRAGVPGVLEQIVLKALAKEPAQRFASAEEMAAALRTSAPGGSVTGVLEVPETGKAPDGIGQSGRRELRWLIPVLLLVAVAIVAAFLIPGLLDNEDDGVQEPGDGGDSPIAVGATRDFDSLPNETEHPDEAPAAADGDPATTWSTENYNTPMHDFKEGVGLVFDLGAPTVVTSLRLVSPTPGYEFEIRISNENGTTLDSFEVVGAGTGTSGTEDVVLDDPQEARFWMVLLTRLPGDGSGNAQIGEVELFGL